MMRWAIIVAGLWLGGTAGAVPRAGQGVAIAADHGCADFLAAMHRRPDHLAYVGCNYLPARQGKPLRATYRVSGKYAVPVEIYLIKAVGLVPLKRSCCQWDAPAHSFKDAKGREYTVTMVSDATSVPSRKAWPRIAQFEVTVETFTEEI